MGLPLHCFCKTTLVSGKYVYFILLVAKYCYAFFDTHIDEEDRRYLSEDYRFCRLWQKLGGEIWLDPKTELNHVGTYTFEGNVKQIIDFNVVPK